MTHLSDSLLCAVLKGIFSHSVEEAQLRQIQKCVTKKWLRYFKCANPLLFYGPFT